MAYVPPGFDPDRIRQGMLTAMSFGAPTRTEDQATFYLQAATTTATRVDDEGVPFDPAAQRTVTLTPKIVPCAVEYGDAAENAESFGAIASTRITVTMLDEEYQQVKGFKYVVCGGDRYYLAKVEPPVALGSIDVWTLICTSLDER